MMSFETAKFTAIDEEQFNLFTINIKRFKFNLLCKECSDESKYIELD